MEILLGAGPRSALAAAAVLAGVLRLRLGVGEGRLQAGAGRDQRRRRAGSRISLRRCCSVGLLRNKGAKLSANQFADQNRPLAETPVAER